MLSSLAVQIVWLECAYNAGVLNKWPCFFPSVVGSKRSGILERTGCLSYRRKSRARGARDASRAEEKTSRLKLGKPIAVIPTNLSQLREKR